MSTALGPWDKYICLHAAHLTFHLNLSVVMADVYPGSLDQDLLQRHRQNLDHCYELMVLCLYATYILGYLCLNKSSSQSTLRLWFSELIIDHEVNYHFAFKLSASTSHWVEWGPPQFHCLYVFVPALLQVMQQCMVYPAFQMSFSCFLPELDSGRSYQEWHRARMGFSRLRMQVQFWCISSWIGLFVQRCCTIMQNGCVI